VTDDEVVEALQIVARAGTLPPPATPEAVAAAEEVIGFPLPPLLRRLYVEVANGGFGPNEGTIWSLVDFRDPAGAMWCNHEGEHWPQGMNLTEWLTDTLAGTLTVEALLMSQPTS